MNRSFFDLSYEKRFEIYGAIDALNCAKYDSGGGGLAVAVAKGKFGELVDAMHRFGLKHIDSYTFPLGTDKPPMHLRHASYGQPDSCWFIACFRVL